MIVSSVMMSALCGPSRLVLAATLPRISTVTSTRMRSSDTRESADIVIAGGGMVGCSAAVALANLGEDLNSLISSQ